MVERGETMEFPVTTPGAAQGAAEFNQLGNSMAKTGQNWDTVSKGSSKAAAGLGAMSTALGPLGDEFGALGQSVSRASGIIGNMTALLGGPWGIAIGLAAAAAGFMADQFADAKKESEELSASLREQADNALLLSEVQNKYLTTLTELGEEEETLREQRAAAANQATLDAINKQEDLTFGPDTGRRGGGGRGFYKGTEFVSPEDAAKEFAVPDPFADPTQTDQNQELADAVLADQEKRNANELRAEAEHKAAMDAIDQQYHEAELARIAERQAAEERMHGFIQGMAEDEFKLGIRAANEAAKGHAMGKKAAVAATGDMLVAAGTRALLEGGIFSATPFMWGSGAGMIAAGTVAIGTGLAMGAASRHMGGGGSGGGKSSGTPQLAPATPVSIQGGSGPQQPQTVIINMQSTLTPNADDYDRMMEAARASRKQGRS